MRLLLTNDDGIRCKALTSLVDALQGEHELFVAAPETEMSGVGHAFTYSSPLGFRRSESLPCTAWEVKGTPADCVKLAICHLLGDKRPDLVLSGVNLGENSGVAVIYSGTVAGAREGALWGIPSLAVSAWDSDPKNVKVAVEWTRNFLRSADPALMGSSSCWNANLPDCRKHEFRGTRLASMSGTMFKDEYVRPLPVDVPPTDSWEYLQLSGYKPTEDFVEGSDDFLLGQGFAVLTPLTISQTETVELGRLQKSGHFKER